MAKSKKEKNEKKELGLGKIIIIVIIVFTFIPITFISVLYFSNDNFKYIANDYLSSFPGVVGQYFEKFPTREERESQKKDVAKYLIGIDADSASDKLIIIQNADIELYGDLVKLMSQLDSRQTERILERVRDGLMKKDILISTLNQIKNDKLTELKEKAQYYEKMTMIDTVEEINQNLTNGKISFVEMGLIMEQMKEDYAAKVLSKLDSEISKKILMNFEMKDKKLKTEDFINKINNRKNQLTNIAQIYNIENLQKNLDDLSTTKKYKIDELSIIYRNMNMIRAAQILSQIEDKQFVYNLFEQMKEDEILEMGFDEFSPNLIRAAGIYEEYEKRVNEFITIFSKMEIQQMVDMIVGLYKSTNPSQKYTINEDETIIISDQDLAVSIMERLQPKTLAEVLSAMDSTVSSQISKKITLPN